MEKLIISAILIFALTNYAYGLGSHGGHHHNYSGSNSGGSIASDNSGENGATFQAFNDSNNGENGVTLQDFNTTGDADSVPVLVPEPATMSLVGSGLIGVGVFMRRKFKK